MDTLKPFPIEVGQYIRVGNYALNDVLPYVVYKKQARNSGNKGSPEYIKATEKNYDGHMVRMTSQRYQLFASKGVTCVNCGVVGEFFGLEKSKYQEGDRCHFNLYGVKNGIEVMITKDHIIPKSKGGNDHIDNYQVMCYECNKNKGSAIEVETKGLENYKYSPTELLNAVKIDEPYSIGHALERLSSLADVGVEFQGGCDGLDALCYHLDRCTCERTILALKMVLKRFDNM